MQSAGIGPPRASAIARSVRYSGGGILHIQVNPSIPDQGTHWRMVRGHTIDLSWRAADIYRRLQRLAFVEDPPLVGSKRSVYLAADFSCCVRVKSGLVRSGSRLRSESHLRLDFAFLSTSTCTRGCSWKNRHRRSL